MILWLLFDVLCVGQIVIFLEFHSPILEPNLNLPLAQCELVRNFDPSPPGQVATRMKLLLQIQYLPARISCPLSLLVGRIGRIGTCGVGVIARSFHRFVSSCRLFARAQESKSRRRGEYNKS